MHMVTILLPPPIIQVFPTAATTGHLTRSIVVFQQGMELYQRIRPIPMVMHTTK